VHLLFTAPDPAAATVALARASAMVRTQIADRLAIKRVPHLHFLPDPRGATSRVTTSRPS
jgi:ribosome-binding factor A